MSTDDIFADVDEAPPAKPEGPRPGDALEQPCRGVHHGAGFQSSSAWYSSYEYDPGCMNCKARAILAQHDHLHLGADADACTTIGIGGVPGQMVKCKCGGFHH